MRLLAFALLFSLSSLSFAEYGLEADNFHMNNSVPLHNVLGAAFIPREDLCVNQIGAFDGRRDGLSNPTKVGIYASKYRGFPSPNGNTGTLLKAVTVPVNTPLTGYFRYVDIDPVTLKALELYSIVSDWRDEIGATTHANGSSTREVSVRGNHSFSLREQSLPAYLPEMQTKSGVPFFGGNFRFTKGACASDPTDPDPIDPPPIGSTSPKCVFDTQVNPDPNGTIDPSNPRCQVPIKMLMQ